MFSGLLNSAGKLRNNRLPGHEIGSSVSDRTASPAARAMFRRISHSFPISFRAEVQGLASIRRGACRLPVKVS